MIFEKSVFLLLVSVLSYSTSDPICYCRNGKISTNSTNPSQCECSVPTGDCGDNEAYVPEGDALTYAKAIGECGNRAQARGNESRAVIHSGKLNIATALVDYGDAEVEGGEENQAQTFSSPGIAKIFGTNSKRNNVACTTHGQGFVRDGEDNHVNSNNGCQASVENSTDNAVWCKDEGGQISIKNSVSNNVWTENGCIASVENARDNVVACESEGGQASAKNGESNLVVVNSDCKASVENGNGNNVTCNFGNSRAYVLGANDCTIWTWLEPLSCSTYIDNIGFDRGQDHDCELAPICYCKNGKISENSINASQCECSVPTGDCGDNEAHVPEGDALTYAKAIGECGNRAYAKGNESIALIHAGKSNYANAQFDYGVAEIEGGERNSVHTIGVSATAKVFGTNSYNNNVFAKNLGQASVKNSDENHVEAGNDCEASVENGLDNVASCRAKGGRVTIKNGESNNVWSDDACIAWLENARDNQVWCKNNGGRASVKDSESNTVSIFEDCEASVENGNGNTVTCNLANSSAYVLNADDCYIWTWDKMLSCSNDTDSIGTEEGRDLDCENVTTPTP